MKIIDLYKSILSTASLVVDKENMISASVRGSTVPFMVSGKRLVLPTHEHLANPDKSGIYIFHPLSENILGGESLVMEKFRHAINTRLNYVLGCLIEELLVIGTSVGEHSKMNPDQGELLTITKDADEKTLNNFRSILKNMGMSDKEKCVVHMFLKRGGKVQGRTFNRAAIVNFPLYKELAKKEKTVYGVTLRNRDRDCIMALLEYVIPGIDSPNHFDKGSESDIGPFLDALMRGLMGIASGINTVVEKYKDFINKPEEFLYASDWVEVFDNLAQLIPEIRAIPMQTGNQAQVPVAPTQMPQNQFAVAPVANPVSNPVNSPVAPIQQFQPQVPAVPAKTASGGLDFHAILNKNPALANMPVMGFPNMGFQGQQAPMSGPQALRNSTPSWAMPNTFGAPAQQFGQPQQNYGYNPNQNRSGFGNV